MLLTEILTQAKFLELKKKIKGKSTKEDLCGQKNVIH